MQNNNDLFPTSDTDPVITEDSDINPSIKLTFDDPVPNRQSSGLAQNTQNYVQFITEFSKSFSIFKTIQPNAVITMKCDMNSFVYNILYTTIQNTIIPPQQSVLLCTGVKMNTQNEHSGQLLSPTGIIFKQSLQVGTAEINNTYH